MKQEGTLRAKSYPGNLFSNTATIGALHYLDFRGVELIGEETDYIIGAGHPVGHMREEWVVRFSRYFSKRFTVSKAHK